MRRAARVDANHKQIKAAFIAYGFSVLDVSQLKNCCDLFVAKNKITIAIEIKDGSKPASAKRLTEGEEKFMLSWRGLYFIVESLEMVENINHLVLDTFD